MLYEELGYHALQINDQRDGNARNTSTRLILTIYLDLRYTYRCYESTKAPPMLRFRVPSSVGLNLVALQKQKATNMERSENNYAYIRMIIKTCINVKKVIESCS